MGGHFIQRLGEDADFVLLVHIHGSGQVAIGHGLGQINPLEQRLGYQAGQQQAGKNSKAHTNHQADDGDHAATLGNGMCILHSCGRRFFDRLYDLLNGNKGVVLVRCGFLEQEGVHLDEFFIGAIGDFSHLADSNEHLFGSGDELFFIEFLRLIVLAGGG